MGSLLNPANKKYRYIFSPAGSREPADLFTFLAFFSKRSIVNIETSLLNMLALDPSHFHNCCDGSFFLPYERSADRI